MSGFEWRRATVSSCTVPALMGLCLVLLGGCLGRSPDVEHFVLASQGPAKVGEAGTTAPAVLVGPVRLPAYLDRPQVARLGAGGSIALDEYTRWLGGFEENFLRAVSFEVARQTGSSRVVTHPSKAPFDFDAKVRLHVDDLVVVEGTSLRVVTPRSKRAMTSFSQFTSTPRWWTTVARPVAKLTTAVSTPSRPSRVSWMRAAQAPHDMPSTCSSERSRSVMLTGSGYGFQSTGRSRGAGGHAVEMTWQRLGSVHAVGSSDRARSASASNEARADCSRSICSSMSSR